MSTLNRALNKLAKWRTVFASWQLGTRSSTDAECKAVKDHREATIMLRAEANALARLLMNKRIITQKEFEDTLHNEVTQLDRAYEEKFPGFSTTDTGVDIDLVVASETMKGWPQ